MSAVGQQSAVRIEGLTVGYRRRGRVLRVLDDVSFSIGRGEAYGLVGESGCGKTTAAMSLMRYLPENAVVEGGRIMFGDEDVLTADDATLRSWRGDRMAMVYQDPGTALNPAIKVGEQIAEVYRFHKHMGKKEALAAAVDMLSTVQISTPERVVRRYPHELSGGQQQRVMFAMALATDPDLLVLDEPTTGLDATVEAEVLDLVEQLRTQFDASILFVSHNLGIVARMCERVGVLYAGRLIEQGPAQELFHNPRHPYTLALLRCMPRLGMRKDVDRLDPIPGSLPPIGADIAGCVYADRCPIARDRCRTDAPPVEPVGAGHGARCFYHREVPQIPPGNPSVAHVSAAAVKDGVLLQVENLVKSYGSRGNEVIAVAGVDIHVARGEVLGLVGESGSGKTSLAKCIVGLIDPSSGRIEFEDMDVTNGRRRGREARRRLQMVFQNPDNALNPAHTVRSILRRSLQLLAGVRGKDTQDEEMNALARSVRLEPRHLDVRPASLSGGMKQRVAIARSFAGKPSMVLCDEPTSALDVSVQAAILNLLVDLQRREGVSYVFISHDLAVVRYVADRIAVMYLGQIVDVGPAEAVFRAPHHPYTEALLSAIPSLDVEARPRIKLHGTLPSPSDPPSGCRFHTRCPRYLGDVCKTVEPPWQATADGQRYSCHIEPEALAKVQAQDAGAASAPDPVA
ncbi:MAG: peptide/nickel transport system ATP-binding protein ddpF [Gaiellales bacterium]|nr:peptide/nickel transport system ATP-binding protein ddpF [Gaiellales bacterium]